MHQQLDLSVDGVNRDYRPLEGYAPERLDLLHVTNPLVQQLLRYLGIPVELQLTELMQVKFESRSDGRASPRGSNTPATRPVNTLLVKEGLSASL